MKSFSNMKYKISSFLLILTRKPNGKKKKNRAEFFLSMLDCKLLFMYLFNHQALHNLDTRFNVKS